MGEKEFKRYARLVTQAKQGNDKAFQQIYEETCRAQLFHLKNHLKDPEELKDALQEVYILLYLNLHKINPPRLLIAYLNRLSYFVGKNMAKKQYHRDKHTVDFEWLELLEEPKAQDLLDNLELHEKQKIIRNTIQKLPQMERSVIFMRYFQNLKHQEVALSLGITQAGSKFIQRSAHTHMRELLKKEGISSWGILMPMYLSHPSIGPLKNKEHKLTDFSSAAGHTSLSSSLAAAGMLAAFIYTGGLIGAPAIQSVQVPGQYTAAPAKVTVKVRSPIPVRRISLNSSGSPAAYGRRTGPDTYTIPVKKNGTYTVTVQANNGKTAVSKADVSCIDSDRPEADCQIRDGRLYARVRDDVSGIDFDSLSCELESGAVIRPESIDRDQGMAIFPLPKETVTLRLRDMAGNRGKVIVDYKK